MLGNKATARKVTVWSGSSSGARYGRNSKQANSAIGSLVGYLAVDFKSFQDILVFIIRTALGLYTQV